MENNIIKQYKQDIIVAFNKYFQSYDSKELEPIYSKVGELLKNKNSYQFYINKDKKPSIVIGKGLYLTYDINIKSIVATIEYLNKGKITPIMDFIYIYKFSVIDF